MYRGVVRAVLPPAARSFATAPNRVLIVGGVAGGATAAARLRRLSETTEITIFERSPDVSFANCGLPYYLGGEIADRSKLLLQTPASLSATLGLTVQANTTVTAINRAAKTITVQPTVPAAASASSSASPVEVPYDKLLISTGAAPFRPPIPGINLAHVMRSMADIDAIKSETDALLAAAAGSGGRKPRAVVLGAGFIGIEAAEQLTRRGFQVTVVEARGHILPAMDAEMVTSLTTDMRQQGVQVLTSSTAAGIVSAGGRHKLEVHLSSGLCLPADLVLLSAGVRPESGLAAAAGLTLDPHTSAIAVNAHMQTSDPHIYAVGDVIAAPSLVYPDVLTWTPLGGPANRQGRLASEHMVKGAAADKYRGSLGTAIVRGFDTTVGVTGMTEARLQQLGKRYETVVVSGTNHASYYPRSEPITLKGLYDPGTRRLLGAQAFGGSEGVDKRLDVLATTIAAHGTIDDLAHLELSYAPPFGSARDVVNTLGFAAQNIAAGVLIPERKLSALPRGRVLLDVRDATSASLKPYNALVPAGTPIVAIPASELRKPEVLAQLDKGAAYTTACAVGKMSYFSARILAQSGFTNVTSLIGGHALAAPPAPNAADADGAYTKPAAATAAATAAASTATAAAPSAAAAGSGQVVEVDACGLACPGPIMKIRTNLPALQPGGVLKVKASDPGFYSDVRAFAAAAGVDLVSVSRDRGVITAVLKRPEAPLDSLMSGTITATTHEHDAAAHAAAQAHAQSVPPTAAATGKAATAAAAAGGNAHDVAIVCFSGEMDKVLAALVIANGAIAMGGSGTIFFTFWGLSALRKDHSMPDLEARARTASSAGAEAVKQGLLDKIMGAMLPSGAGHLPLSHMNYGGAGAVMMEHVMSSKHLPNIAGLMRSAMDSGKVRFVACTMSMDALGIPADQLLPGVELGGVADFLGAAGKAHTTLFI